MLRRLLVLLTLVALAAPAAAVDAEQLADRLVDDPVLVADGAAVTPDEDAVADALDDLPVPTYVLVLPQSAVDAEESGIDGVLLRVVEALDDPRAVVVVVSDGGELQAGEGGASGVAASRVLDAIVQERSDVQAFDGRSLTAALLDFADAVERDGQEGAERGVTSASRRTIGVAGLLAVGLLAAGWLWARSQARARSQAPLSDAERDDGNW